jgi:amino-acid N-acetyltransferase
MAIVNETSSNDLEAALQLLRQANLPLDGVAEHFGDFLAVHDEQRLIGLVGLEFYERRALIRSLVVAPENRGAGLGTSLVDAALSKARSRGACCVFLATEGARDFFLRRGFQDISRTEAEAAVGESVEFTLPCCDAAAFLRTDLAPALS